MARFFVGEHVGDIVFVKMKKGSFKQELQEDLKLCGRCFRESI